MDNEERKLSRVPIWLGTAMGAFVVVAAIVVLIMWAAR